MCILENTYDVLQLDSRPVISYECVVPLVKSSLDCGFNFGGRLQKALRRV